jgi:hypothetical protein
MMSKEIIASLRLVHGGFNTILCVLFSYQGSLGIRIRKGRKEGVPAFKKTIRHRKLGPVLATLGILGFFAGLTLVLFDKGHVLEYPLHFFNGMVLAVLIFSTFMISRKIRGADSSLRTPHFIIGIIILALYVVQVVLGLGILL